VTTNTEVNISVGLGEIHVTGDPDAVLICYGLGSCIAVSAFDPVAKVGAMAHIVLPVSNNGSSATLPAKYADSGIPLTVEKMEKAGARRSRIVIKMAGGAKMLHGVQAGSILDIGERNIVAVSEAMRALGIKIQGQDTRGNWGRCLWLYMATGLTRVKTADQRIVEL
jgi:chemotaxis protein CheD